MVPREAKLRREVMLGAEGRSELRFTIKGMTMEMGALFQWRIESWGKQTVREWANGSGRLTSGLTGGAWKEEGRRAEYHARAGQAQTHEIVAEHDAALNCLRWTHTRKKDKK